MGVLLSIEKCLSLIPKDIIDESTIYIEVNKETYDLLQGEITATYNLSSSADLNESELRFVDQRIEDFGVCSILMHRGYRIIVALDKKKKISTGNFYVAFKTKIV